MSFLEEKKLVHSAAILSFWNLRETFFFIRAVGRSENPGVANSDAGA
jgi:hypothetical protein